MSVRIMPLGLKLKGGRNYIHGSDIFNKVIGCVSEEQDLDSLELLRLKIRRKSSMQCRLHLGELNESVAIPQDAVAEILFKLSDGSVSGYLAETGEDIAERYDYDEDSIVQQCSLSDKSIKLEGAPPYSPIEVAIAMGKALHSVLLPDSRGRLLFSQLELFRALKPEDIPKLVIRLEHNFKNTLTKSSLNSGDARIGFIYYSMEKK